MAYNNIYIYKQRVRECTRRRHRGTEHSSLGEMCLCIIRGWMACAVALARLG